jgi:hypothetical protein
MIVTSYGIKSLVIMIVLFAQAMIIDVGIVERLQTVFGVQ